MYLDANAVAFAHSLEQHSQVEFAHAVKHGLVDCGMVLDAHTRVLCRQLVKGIRQPLLIAAALRLNGDAEHRWRETHDFKVILVLIVGVVEHRVQVQLFDLGDGADVPGNRLRNLRGVLAHHLIKVRDFDGLARIAHKELAAGPDRALVHAQKAELADVRIDRDFEDVRDHMLRPVGDDGHARLSVRWTLQKVWRIAFGRIGEQSFEDLQQLGHSGAGFGRHEAHRHEVPLAQRALKRVVKLLRRQLLALFEIQGHQTVIDFDHLIEDLGMCRGG